MTSGRHYREALRLWPDYAEAHYNYAILLQAMNDRTGAAAHYQQAVKCRPNYTDARLRYAGLLTVSGNVAEAERQYQEVLRLRPGHAEAHNNYGVFLEKRGDTAAAQQHYLEALEQRIDYAEAHYNYAMSLEAADPAEASGTITSRFKSRPTTPRRTTTWRSCCTSAATWRAPSSITRRHCACGRAIRKQITISPC